MIYGLYLSAQAATAENARAQNTANNLANANTPSFRKDIMVFKQRFPESLEQEIKWLHVNPLLDKIGGGVQVADTFTDFSNRDVAVAQTGNPYDLALEGEGFFKVRDAAGQELYTRAGNFTRDGAGTLVQQGSGAVVLDVDGEPITLPDDDFTVDPSGAVLNGSVAVGQLALATFEDLQDLMKVGGNLYRYAGQGRALPAQAAVRQGALEGSGVNPIIEMTAMINGFRAYEANMRMIQSTDQTLEMLVNRVARSAG